MSSSAVLFVPTAMHVYLEIDDRCAAKYPKRFDATYMAEEIQRIVQLIASDPDHHEVQKHRIPWNGKIIFAAIIPTATEIEDEAAVFWRRRDGDSKPVVLGITLDYQR